MARFWSWKTLLVSLVLGLVSFANSPPVGAGATGLLGGLIGSLLAGVVITYLGWWVYTHLRGTDTDTPQPAE